MSYGVWRERGKGWSAIEIDGAGRDTWRWEEYADKYGERFAMLQKKQIRDCGHQCSTSLYGNDPEDDFYFVRWALGQYRRNRRIVECNTGGDHSLWISYDNQEALAKAKAVLNENRGYPLA